MGSGRVICSRPAQGALASAAWTPLPGPPTSAPRRRRTVAPVSPEALARTDRHNAISQINLPAHLRSARLCSPRVSSAPDQPSAGAAPQHLQRTGVSAVSAIGRPVANRHYYAGSDSCRRSPPPAGLPVYLTLPSNHSAPNHVMRTTIVCSRQSQRRRRLSGFATRSQARRNIPPNQVRHPTD